MSLDGKAAPEVRWSAGILLNLLTRNIVASAKITDITCPGVERHKLITNDLVDRTPCTKGQ